MTAIWTYTGGPRNGPPRFDVLAPDATAIHALDIAAGLAGKFRFGGQSPRLKTIARHSLEVAEAVNRAAKTVEAGQRALWTYWALLHDAPEAYLADVPRPYRDRFAIESAGSVSYVPELEAGILEAIEGAFMVEGSNLVYTAPIVEADDAACQRDAKELWIYPRALVGDPIDDGRAWLDQFAFYLSRCLSL